MLRFRTFMCVFARYRPDVRGGGGCFPNGQCQTGGSKKSVFARTPLIDYPLVIVILYSQIINDKLNVDIQFKA